MMEILFRGRRQDNGEWVYGFPFATHANLIVKGIEPWDGERHLVDTVTVGQYICRKDINNRKIFTGDIVRTYSRWSDLRDLKFIVVSDSCFTEDGFGRHWPQDTIDIEVIGNVHDNPDLVGKKHADLYNAYHCLEEKKI